MRPGTSHVTSPRSGDSAAIGSTGSLSTTCRLASAVAWCGEDAVGDVDGADAHAANTTSQPDRTPDYRRCAGTVHDSQRGCAGSSLMSRTYSCAAIENGVST